MANQRNWIDCRLFFTGMAVRQLGGTVLVYMLIKENEDFEGIFLSSVVESVPLFCTIVLPAGKQSLFKFKTYWS